MTEKNIDIPILWQNLPITDLNGTMLVIGAPDVGKSTLARYLFMRLCSGGRRIAFLDGDPGQSNLEPPASMKLAIGVPGEDAFPPRGEKLIRFIGAVTPKGHMLPVLVGAVRLINAAHDTGIDSIVYDTSGLVDPSQGGSALKLAKIDLLRPSVIIAIQGNRELEDLLTPLRRSRRAKILELEPSAAAERRDPSRRRSHRSEQFRRFFDAAKPLTFYWPHLAVFPNPRFAPNRLISFEDKDGFSLSMGIVQVEDRRTRQVTALTPLTSLQGVDAVRLGDLWIDPDTFADQAIVQV